MGNEQHAPPDYPPPNQPSYNQQQQDNTYHVRPDMENQQDLKYYDNPQQSDNFDDSFKIEKPKLNDWPFTIFFLLVLAGFIAVAGITLNALRRTYGYQGGGIYGSANQFTFNTNTIILFAFIIVVSFVVSFLVILLARVSPKWFIIIGIVANVVLGIGTAIFYFVEHYYSAAIVFLIFALLACWCYWSSRHRIPLSAEILSIVIDVMKMYPSTYITSFIGLIVSAAFSVLFSVVIVATYVKYDPNSNNEACSVGGGSCSNGKKIGVLVFVFFAGYYISEVIKNVIHVVISGIYGTWYFLSSSDQGQPKHPALGALKRALTYCFGSICFGSLIVSLIQLLRQGIGILRSNFAGDGNACGVCGMIVLDWVVGFIDWLVQYFNRYAYCYVALYGKNYIRSAKDTFDLLRFKGMDVLVNDMFINTSLHLWSLFSAYLVALLGYLYLKFTDPGYNSDGQFYAPVVAFSFLISGQISRIALSTIESGTASFFVCLAKSPEVFRMSNPAAFQKIFNSYPQVLEKITKDN